MKCLPTVVILSLTFALGACGNGDNGGMNSVPTPTATASLAPPTASPSASAAATATSTTSATHTPSTIPTPTVTLPPPTDSPVPTTTPTPTASPVPTETETPSAVTALFSIDARDPSNPFPSDRQRDANGRIDVVPRVSSLLPPEPRYDQTRTFLATAAEQLRELTGFSTFAPIRIPLDGPAVVSEDEAPPGIFVMPQADPGTTVPIHAGAVIPETAGDFAIEIFPLLPLAPKTRYVYAVTSALRDHLGRPLRAEAVLTDALCNETIPEQLSDWRRALEPSLAHLAAAHGIACTDIVAMDVFTTQPTTDDLIAIRDLFDGGRLPIASPILDGSRIGGMETGIFEEGTPQFAQLVGAPTSEALRAVAVGRFASFDFRAGRVFDPERVAGRSQPTAIDLAFYVAIPKAPPPPEGYPLVIYGHGLSRSGEDAILTATSFDDLPMVWVGISAVSHGHRGNFINFFNLSNILATRDSFRQSIADLLQLQRMIRHTDHEPFADVNRERIHYYGISLGGIMGTLYMGVEPDIEVAMLSVPGGGLPNILSGSDIIGALIDPLISFSLGVTTGDPMFPILRHHFVHQAQLVLDPGDPINMAPYLLGPDTLPGVPPKRILLHEGIADSVVPNRTTEDLALAMRLPDVKSTLGCDDASGCSGIWRYVMTEYDRADDCGHLVAFVIPEAHRQSIKYLFTNGTVIEDASPRLAPDERPECLDLTGVFP